MNNTKKLALAGLAISVSLGCRVLDTAEADKQVQKKLDAELQPSFPATSGGFSLTNGNLGKKAIRYSPASVVFFNENFNPENGARLLELSKLSRQTRADHINWAADAYETKEEAEDSIVKLSLANRQHKKSGFDREQGAKVARGWFQENVATQVDNPAEATDYFNKVCEAYVWDMATSKMFIAKEIIDNPAKARNQEIIPRSYAAAPIPLAICQDHYDSIGLFDTESCKEPPKGDYTKCVWESLTQTHWFQKISLEKEEKIQGLKEMINNPEEFDNLLKLAISGRSGAFCIKKGLCRGRYRKYQSLFNFKKEGMIPPQTYLDSIKNTEEQWQLPTVEGEDFTYTDMIYYLGTRTNIAPSTSDELFHQLVEDSYPSLSPHEDVLDAATIELYETYFGPILTAISVEKQAIIQANLETIENLKQEILDIEKTDEDYSKNLGSVLDESTDFLNEHRRMAAAFLAFTMDLKRTQTTLEISWFPGTSDKEITKVQGCVHILKGSSLKEGCQTTGSMVPFDHISYQPETGRIRVIMDLDRADEFGLFKDVGQGYFFGSLSGRETPSKEELSDAYKSLEGKYLQMDLYPNRLDGVLDIATGKAFIKDKGVDHDDKLDYIYQGSVSAFEDQEQAQVEEAAGETVL